MKSTWTWFLVLALLLSVPAFAHNKSDDLSFQLGASAIGSEAGYSFGVTTPYFESTAHDKNLALSFSFDQYFLSNRDFMMLKLAIINRFIEVMGFKAYMKTGPFFIPATDFMMTDSFGLSFALGSEFIKHESSFSLFSELGYSLPFIRTPLIAQGVSVLLGMKLYL